MHRQRNEYLGDAVVTWVGFNIGGGFKLFDFLKFDDSCY